MKLCINGMSVIWHFINLLPAQLYSYRRTRIAIFHYLLLNIYMFHYSFQYNSFGLWMRKYASQHAQTVSKIGLLISEV